VGGWGGGGGVEVGLFCFELKVLEFERRLYRSHSRPGALPACTWVKSPLRKKKTLRCEEQHKPLQSVGKKKFEKGE